MWFLIAGWKCRMKERLRRVKIEERERASEKKKQMETDRDALRFVLEWHSLI